MRRARFGGRKVAVLAAALVVLATAGTLAWSYGRRGAPDFRGAAVDPPYPVSDFALIDQDGRPFRLSSLRGRAVALFFGYTSCPDVCPATLLDFRLARQQLGPEADRVAFVFVTVDPERDVPARMKAYVSAFDPAVAGLTGTPEAVAEVLGAYGVFAQKVPVEGSSSGYLMNHTATVYLIDPLGYLRDAIPPGTTAADLVHDIRQILPGRR